MTALEASGPNADQITYWNSNVGETWAKNQALMDANLAAVSARLLDVASPAPGERVLDIGCGCGDTSFAAARRVGPAGRVVGVDISGPMLGRAREIAGTRDASGTEFILADAATYAFAPKSFDLALSRFGVMFFADSIAAFANIRAALKPGGRLVFACWQPPKLNAWVMVPMEAALAHVPPPPAPPDPLAPGPFAFADPKRVDSILRGAGFSAITATPFTFGMSLGLGGPNALDDAVNFAAEIGPTARLLRDSPEDRRPPALAAIREALRSHLTPEGVVLGGAVWMVEARA